MLGIVCSFQVAVCCCSVTVMSYLCDHLDCSMPGFLVFPGVYILPSCQPYEAGTGFIDKETEAYTDYMSEPRSV